MVINNIFLFILLLNIFFIGIKKVSIFFFLKFKILPLNKNNSGILSVAVFLGILLFCILSNLILLIPSLIFFWRYPQWEFHLFQSFQI